MHTLPEYVDSNASGTNVITFGNVFITRRKVHTAFSASPQGAL